MYKLSKQIKQTYIYDLYNCKTKYTKCTDFHAQFSYSSYHSSSIVVVVKLFSDKSECASYDFM